MNRQIRWVIVGAVCTAMLAACGGSSKSNTAAQSTGSSAAGSAAPTSVASSVTPKELPSACTLASSADVGALLGADAGSGTPQDFDPGYKTCSWTVVPPGAANANALRLGVVAISNSNKGFGQPSNMGNPTTIPGLGDQANLYVNADPNFPEYTLIAIKGGTSVSADAHLTGSQTDPATVETDLVNIVRSAFTAAGS